jgi:hypothetical protein
MLFSEERLYYIVMPVHGEDIDAQQQGEASTAYSRLLMFQEGSHRMQSRLISASSLKFWISMKKK